MSVVIPARDDWAGRLTALIDRHQVPLACIASTALLLALHYHYNITYLPNDAAEYWRFSKPGVLGNLPTHRGYVWALLLLPLHFVYDAASHLLTTFRLGLSLAYGVLLPTLLPAVFVQAFGGKVSFLRRLLPVCLLAQLFPGLLLYPLSDLPALLMALAALLCVLRALQPSTPRTAALTLIVMSGVLMGAAYNTRTIYLFALVGLSVMLALRSGLAKCSFQRWLGLTAFATGLLAVSLPQLTINQRTHGVTSLAVISHLTDKQLFAKQLLWGITLQRYETALPQPAAGGAAAFYIDPAGERLFRKLAGEGHRLSIGGYLKMVARHPMDFAALYARHAINGLDVRDGMVYTLKPSPLRNRTALYNFSVLALAAWVAWTLRRQAATGVRTAPFGWRLSLVVLMLPVVAILPGAIETRFFLPLHLLAYCVIAFHFDAAALRQSFRREGKALVVVTAIAAGLFFAVTLSTMAQLQSTWPIYFRDGMPQKNGGG